MPFDGEEAEVAPESHRDHPERPRHACVGALENEPSKIIRPDVVDEESTVTKSPLEELVSVATVVVPRGVAGSSDRREVGIEFIKSPTPRRDSGSFRRSDAPGFRKHPQDKVKSGAHGSPILVNSGPAAAIREVDVEELLDTVLGELPCRERPRSSPVAEVGDGPRVSNRRGLRVSEVVKVAEQISYDHRKRCRAEPLNRAKEWR